MLALKTQIPNITFHENTPHWGYAAPWGQTDGWDEAARGFS